MTKQKHSSKNIIRKIIVWTLVILSLPLILLGEPAIKVFGLIVAGLVIFWDVATSKNKLARQEHQKEATASHQPPVVSEPAAINSNDIITLPKKPILIALVIIIVIGAYSLGYATGKNTAVRLSNEPIITAP